MFSARPEQAVVLSLPHEAIAKGELVKNITKSEASRVKARSGLM